MAVKFEVTIIAGESTKSGDAVMSAVTEIKFLKEGFTHHEQIIAEWIQQTVDDLFRTKFKSVQHSVNNIEEHKNVH